MAYEGAHRINKNEQSVNPEELHSAYETFIKFRELLEENGFVMYEKVGDAYRQLGDSTYVVRREDPLKILSLLGPAGEYNVGYVGGTPYSNCVEWNPRVNGNMGIENAYFEGFTNLNNVVTVIGFERGNETSFQRLPDATSNFHGLNRHLVRSFSGPIKQDNVRFINLRVPAHLLPEIELTEEEQNILFERNESIEKGIPTEPLMIHRSFIRTIAEEDEMKKAA